MAFHSDRGGLRERLRDFFRIGTTGATHRTPLRLTPLPAVVPPTDPPLQTPAETIKAWSEYAKDRFESEADRIVEFRNWGRQLAAGIAVIIAFEVNAVVQFVLKGNGGDPFVGFARAAAIIAFGWAGWRQGRALRDALRVGYLGDKLTGPENPAKLGEFILGKDEWETSRLIGAYYAKGYTEFYELAEKLGLRVGKASLEFQKSLRALFLGLILLLVGLWGPSAFDTVHTGYVYVTEFRSGSAGKHTDGAEQPTVDNPGRESALGHPHSGRINHEGQQPGRVLSGELVSTPTNDSAPAPIKQAAPEVLSPTAPIPTPTQMSRLLDAPTPRPQMTESERS